MEKGAQPNEKYDSGNTPLHHALNNGIKCQRFPESQRKYVEMAMYLIEKGAQINAKNHNGNTPLHQAVMQTI